MQPDKKNSAQHTSEWSALPQIRDQIIHTIQMSPQKCLLLHSCSDRVTLTICPLSAGSRLCHIKCSSKLTRTALQHRWHRLSCVRGWDRGGLGHEIEVEKFNQLELHFSARFARLEERGDGKEAVEVFECT